LKKRKAKVLLLPFGFDRRKSIFAYGHINHSLPGGSLFGIQVMHVDGPGRYTQNPK
jgi:hypothetical protein